MRLRGSLLCPGRDVAPGPGGALRGDALRYLPLRACECPRTPPLPEPPSPGTCPQDRALLGMGWQRGEFDLFTHTPPLTAKGRGDPCSRTPGCSPRLSSGEERGALKDQASFLLLPLLRDGPRRPPPLLRAAPRGQGWRGRAQLGRGLEAGGGVGWGGPGLAAVQAAGGCARCPGDCRWATMGAARLHRGDMAWHTLARLSRCSPPVATPLPSRSRGTAGGSQRGK